MPELVRVEPDQPAAPRWELPGRLRKATSSIRSRVLAWYLLLFAASTIVAIVAIGQILGSRVDDDADAALTNAVDEFQLLAAGTDPATGEPFGTDTAAIFTAYSDQHVPSDGEIYLGLLDGEVRGGTPPDLALQMATPELVETRSDIDEPTWGESDTPAGTMRWLAVPTETDGGPTDALFVAAIDIGAERSEVSSTVRTIAYVFVVVLAIAAAIAWASTGRLLAPLKGIIDTTRRLTAVDLSERMAVEGDDEIAELTATLNGLLDRIETAIPIQLQFLDDLGHEFEEPIATIRGHLDDLPEDLDERQEAIGACRRQLDRLSNDLEDLLTLAEAPQPEFLVRREVSIGRLLSDVHGLAREVAPGRLWEVDRVHEGFVVCDPDRVKQAMINLAANAAQHTGPGDRIEMGSSIIGDSVRFWVHDRGPVVGDDAAAEMFERIGPAPADEQGARVTTGLLLPVVAAIADAHGGHTEISSTASDGTTFAIVLPNAQRAIAGVAQATH